MPAAIQLRGVTKTYSAKTEVPVTALDGVELTVQAGEFVALKGSSGSGKTTLLNIASGLDLPSTGQVVLAGEDISKFTPRRLTEFRSRRIGFVFQSYNLFRDLSVVENVEFTLLLRGDDPAESRALALSTLKDVGLEKMAYRFPQQLSGGQQQRVAVARAIATRPVIIFADEPTANLDSKTASDLIGLFQEMNEKTGITFLFSTHDPHLLGRVKRVLEIQDGRILTPQG